MTNFIYAFSEEDRDELLKQGMKQICEMPISGKITYVFENKPDKVFFNENNKKKFLFTNKVFFNRG